MQLVSGCALHGDHTFVLLIHMVLALVSMDAVGILNLIGMDAVELLDHVDGFTDRYPQTLGTRDL